MTLDELSLLAEKYGTDKQVSQHNYTPIYYNKFYNFRNSVQKVLEIGVALGSSLKMWSKFFPNAQIYGVDININNINIIKNDWPNIELLQGNINSNEIITKIKNISNYNIDIIIDDGSHEARDIIPAFNNLFLLLKDGGTYIIEDIETSGIITSNPSMKETLTFFKDLVKGRVVRNTYSEIEKHIISIEFFPHIIILNKGISTMQFVYSAEINELFRS